jgi:hypothetical protein
MKTDNKHYKFINSQTGNAIFYHQVDGKLKPDELKAELEKIKAHAATQNALPINIIYWEEVKDAK